MKLIHVYTDDNIHLTGLEYKSNNYDSCCLLIPGLGGNYIDNKFISVIGDALKENNINYIVANTRGSFILNYSYTEKIRERPVEIGVICEMFDDSLFDIKAWIEYAIKSGYKKITLMGHSLGNNKIIHFCSSNIESKKAIKEIIMLSPCDYSFRLRNKPLYEEVLKKSKLNCLEGKEREILFFDFFYKYSYSMLDILNNNNVNNFPIMSHDKSKIKKFSDIELPITILFGSKEPKITETFDFIMDNCNDKNICNIDLIENAVHSFNGSEQELAKKVLTLQVRR